MDEQAHRWPSSRRGYGDSAPARSDGARKAGTKAQFPWANIGCESRRPTDRQDSGQSSALAFTRERAVSHRAPPPATHLILRLCCAGCWIARPRHRDRTVTRDNGCEDGTNASQWELAVHLVEVLLSGAFVLGLTTVAGAVWFAGQLRGIGLTGSEAISALPRSELLTKGADQLIPFALIAVAEVAVVLLVDKFGRSKETGPWPLDKANTLALGTSCFLIVGGSVLLLVRAGPPTGRGFLGWIGTLAIRSSEQ